jgi:hypothetical protein
MNGKFNLLTNRAYAEVTKIAEPYLVGKASAIRTQIPDGRF